MSAGSYAIAREGVTPVAGNVLLALISGADEAYRVTEVSVGGEATSSTVNRMVVRRSTTNGSTATAQTPAELAILGPASVIDGATTFMTEPTTAAAPGLWTYALNVFGGVVRWVAAPGQEIYGYGNTAGNNEVSLESSSGTGVISCQVLYEEY